MSEDEGLLCACDRRGGQLHDYGSECGPRVYPARPESPGLPPVGELVQITYRDVNPWRPEDAAPVRTALGYVDTYGTWWTVFEGNLGDVSPDKPRWRNWDERSGAVRTGGPLRCRQVVAGLVAVLGIYLVMAADSTPHAFIAAVAATGLVLNLLSAELTSHDRRGNYDGR